MKLFEIIKNADDEDDKLGEAMWWVTRWVSGSIDDPDWETDWLTSVKDVQTAFRIVHNVIGNKYSANKILWRYLKLSKNDAKKIVLSKQLMPFNNHHAPFQSFTTNKSVALDLPDELQIRTGNTNVLVSAKVPANLIMFGMKDLLSSKNQTVRQWISDVDEWHYQDEVIVLVQNNLPLQTAEII